MGGIKLKGKKAEGGKQLSYSFRDSKTDIRVEEASKVVTQKTVAGEGAFSKSVVLLLTRDSDGGEYELSAPVSGVCWAVREAGSAVEAGEVVARFERWDEETKAAKEAERAAEIEAEAAAAAAVGAAEAAEAAGAAEAKRAEAEQAESEAKVAREAEAKEAAKVEAKAKAEAEAEMAAAEAAAAEAAAAEEARAAAEAKKAEEKKAEAKAIVDAAISNPNPLP